MDQISSYRERTPYFFTRILLYLSIFKPFTCLYAWLLIFIINQNRSMPYDRQGFQSMCNHAFLQRIFTILSSSHIVFFCNSNSFRNFPFLINQSFCGTSSASSISCGLSHDRWSEIGLNKHLLLHILFRKLLPHRWFLVHNFPIVDLRSNVDFGSWVF